jgi:hypothetical protein
MDRGLEVSRGELQDKEAKDASYISASDYICNTKMTGICSVTEEENNLYHDNLQMVCFYNVAEV